MSHNRRRILGAALALPAALTAAEVLSAAPAVAAGGIEAQPWTDLALEPGVTAQAGAAPQIRLVTIAGTAFLQARGSVACNLTADQKVATLPAELRPTGLVRATAPRNNSQGINACRFEVNTAGSLTIYGGNSGNPITWVQFDSVQTVWH
ncbi:hypothetical protein [Streptomyces globosus]|uniref:hypothetical protein n=1 Tax=Streptomyces globosus TaxID=68209 RepID=UPI003814CB1B